MSGTYALLFLINLRVLKNNLLEQDILRRMFNNNASIIFCSKGHRIGFKVVGIFLAALLTFFIITMGFVCYSYLLGQGSQTVLREEDSSVKASERRPLKEGPTERSSD